MFIKCLAQSWQTEFNKWYMYFRLNVPWGHVYCGLLLFGFSLLFVFVFCFLPLLSVRCIAGTQYRMSEGSRVGRVGSAALMGLLSGSLTAGDRWPRSCGGLMLSTSLWPWSSLQLFTHWFWRLFISRFRATSSSLYEWENFCGERKIARSFTKNVEGIFSLSSWWSSWPVGQSEPKSSPTRMSSRSGGPRGMGPTRVFWACQVAPDSIRGSFGLTNTCNTTHGSDCGFSQ